MLWLPVFLLAPVAAMRVWSRMGSPCDRPERYESREEALDAIGMHPFVERFHNSVGSIPVSLCSDCGGFHTWRYCFRVAD